MTEQLKNAINLMIQYAKNVYASSVDENGYPNTKAMFSLQQDGLSICYFSTNLSSMRTS